MKKREKILIAESFLNVTFIMLCVSLFLKLVGLDILDADLSNKILIFFTNILAGNIIIDFIVSFIFLFLHCFILFRLSCKNNKKIPYYVATITCVAINMFAQWYLNMESSVNDSILGIVYLLISIGTFLFTPVIIDIRIKSERKKGKTIFSNLLYQIYDRIKRPIIFIIITNIYQLLVLYLRNITYIEAHETLYNNLLIIDHLILLIFTYYLFLQKELNAKLKNMFNFSFPKLLDEKPSIERIREIRTNYKEKKEEFKELNKEEKIVHIIYIILFILSELFNLALIIFIATINHALIECLFVVSSFLITRKIFGAFHFDSAWKCWIVSNLSFFILNKVTVGAGISTGIPILCGIGLSYLTSKFIKKQNTTPYRGMPEQELKDMYRNKKLTKFEKELLVEFYCHRETLVKLTFKYHFSERALYRYKSAALQKLELPTTSI